MKTSTTNSETENQIDTLSKKDLVLIKATIAVFGIVLNMCFFQLYYYY